MHHSEKINKQLLLVTDLQAVSHISAIKLFKWNNYTRWFFKYLAFLWLMIQITPSSLMLSFVLCFWLLAETFTSYWRSHSSQTVFVFWKWVLTLSSPRYQCNEINDRNSLGKFFSCWFWNWHFTQFFFFFLICRTSLRLGENRGPSIWDVLCWVSLYLSLCFPKMFPFHCTILGSEWSTLHFCNPASRFCHQGNEEVGTVGIYFTDSVLPRNWLWSKYREPRVSCSDD